MGVLREQEERAHAAVALVPGAHSAERRGQFLLELHGRLVSAIDMAK